MKFWLTTTLLAASLGSVANATLAGELPMRGLSRPLASGQYAAQPETVPAGKPIRPEAVPAEPAEEKNSEPAGKPALHAMPGQKPAEAEPELPQPAVAVPAVPALESVREQVLALASSESYNNEHRVQVAKRWEALAPDATPRAVHDLAIVSLGILEPAVEELTARFNYQQPFFRTPQIADMLAACDDEMFKVNLELWVGRHLTEQRLFDEALPIFDRVTMGPEVCQGNRSPQRHCSQKRCASTSSC